MAAKIFSCLNIGLYTELIEVEAEILRGLSCFTIVGLGDTAVQEARERIRAAVKASGAKYPQEKKIINLAPAHLRKAGPHFDLPMAAALLAASGQLDQNKLACTLIVGELALNGEVKSVNGVLTMAIFAKKKNWQQIIVPAANYAEAKMVTGIEVVPVASIRDLINFLRNGDVPKCEIQTPKFTKSENEGVDLKDIKGQGPAKRALMIAAAGGHHLLFTGPPGTGKTLLANAFRHILPPLTPNEQMEVMQIYSCAGLLKQLTNRHKIQRPFRQVHQSSTLLTLIGGGSKLQPGEISLAHRGTLFLDEIAEFPLKQLESLRQPLENRKITITRTSGNIIYPANFILIASMNPCPCGYQKSSVKECTCRPYQVIQYQKKLSGPLRDRIDLTVEVPRQTAHTMVAESSQLTSAEAKKQILAARQIQQKRFKNSKTTNASIPPSQIKIYCRLAPDAENFLTRAAENQALSGRKYHQTLKVARTIADLNRQSKIQLNHIAEALQYQSIE